MPDVLIQAHSAPLGIAFYEGDSSTTDYRGDAFVALHGSWDRGLITGYKVVRLLFRQWPADGRLRGFHDGLRRFPTVPYGDGRLGSRWPATRRPDRQRDGSGTLWRIAYQGSR